MFVSSLTNLNSKILENIAHTFHFMHCIHCIHIHCIYITFIYIASSHTHCVTGSHDGFLISSLFISVRRDGIRDKHQEPRSTECPSSSGNSGTGKGATRTESPDNQEEKEAQRICRLESPEKEDQNPSQKVQKATDP